MNFFRRISYGFSSWNVGGINASIFVPKAYYPDALKRIIMKLNLIVLIITLTGLQIFATDINAQNISIKLSNAPLSKVFDAIKKQSRHGLWYDQKDVPREAKISVDLKNADLDKALETCLKDQPLTYEIVDKVIIIKRKELGILERINNFFRQLKISGKVTDQQGQPMPGVTVTVQGSNRSVVTDNLGRYAIIVMPNDILDYNFMGYAKQSQKVQFREVIDIMMSESVGQLDQVQIQGYGLTTQRLATGNIATIKAEAIGQQPVTNPLQAISGRVAGVQVSQSSGLPGTGMTVQIRGRNSIVANNGPLFIVDEVPFFSDNLTGGSQIATISPINSINPNDIESITILKDADATAIYGSRAANGVVLITTKKGKAGNGKLDVNFSNGYSSATRIAEVMSTTQYLQVRRDAFANSGTTPSATNAPDLVNWDPNVDNNMLEHYMGNTATVWDAAASYSGGSEQTQFVLSGNFHQENSLFSNADKYLRGNMRFSISHSSKDRKLAIRFTGLYASDHNRIRNIVSASPPILAGSIPNYPYYTAAGTYNWEANMTNFKAQENSYTKSATDNMNLSLNMRYNITSQLQFISNFGLNKIINDVTIATPSIAKNPASSSPLGNAAFRNQNGTTYLVEPQLKYSHKLIGGDLSVLVGATVQNRSTLSDYLVNLNYLSDLLIENKMAGTVSYLESIPTKYNFMSLFARANYNWQDRYIINGTFRRDGSSRFGPNKRFGNFGSIGAAWIFTSEPILKNRPSWFSYGKLRASYGTTGSDGIGDYGYLSLYDFTFDYGSQKAMIPSQIENKDYRWEQTKKMEAALDLGFFKDRLLLTTAYYRNRTGNQLVTYPLPATTGFTGYIANLPAVVENTGWEFEVSSRNFEGGKLKWSTTMNLTIPRNKLVEFPNIELTSYANSLVIGKPLNLYLAYQYAGLNSATGVPSVADVSGNGTISANSFYNGRGGDKVYTGTTDPKWYAGFGNAISFKGFTLDLFFQYTKQKGYNLFTTNNGFGTFGTLRNGFTAYLDYWKTPGDLSPIPKPLATSNTDISRFTQSDFAFSDASFLRLKTASLNYTLPEKAIKKLGMSGIQLFVVGQNLWTKTDYIGQDPEQASATTIQLSPLKTLSFGFKSTF